MESDFYSSDEGTYFSSKRGFLRPRFRFIRRKESYPDSMSYSSDPFNGPSLALSCLGEWINYDTTVLFLHPKRKFPWYTQIWQGPVF